MKTSRSEPVRFTHAGPPPGLLAGARRGRSSTWTGKSATTPMTVRRSRAAPGHLAVSSPCPLRNPPRHQTAARQLVKVLSRTRPARSLQSRQGAGRAGDGGDDGVDGAAIDLAGLAEHAAERHARHINPVLIGVGGPTGLTRTFVRGEGAELFDESGRAYLDFVAGFGSLNLGHNHPEVVAAVASALRQQAPGFSPASVNPLAAALAEQLVAITPRGLEMVFFTNSGAESVEAALKLAQGGDRPERVALVPGLVPRQDPRGPLGHGEPDVSAAIRAAGPRLPGDPLRRRTGPGIGPGHPSVCRLRGRADPGGRGNGHTAARVSGRVPTASAGSLARSSSPTRYRPVWGGPGRCSPSSARGSSPTS